MAPRQESSTDIVPTTDTSNSAFANDFHVVRERKRYKRNLRKFKQAVDNGKYSMRISNDGGLSFRRVEVTMGTKGMTGMTLFARIRRLLRDFESIVSMHSAKIVYDRKYGYPRYVSYEYMKQYRTGETLLMQSNFRAKHFRRLFECSGFSNCLDCLRAKGCNAWLMPSSGLCLRSCSDGPSDTPCYSKETRSGGNRAICKQAEIDALNSALCREEEDCASCVQVKLHDGVSTCNWYPAANTCAASGRLLGPPTSQCQSSDKCSLGTGGSIRCSECLQDETCDAWVTVGSSRYGMCYTGCEDGPSGYGIFCYKKDHDETSDSVCAPAEQRADDEAMCTAAQDCRTCVSTELFTKRNETCQWFAGSDGDGSCRSTCLVGGFGPCGNTTCSA